MIRALQRACFVLASIGLVALLIWNASERPELRPADTEALRRLQATIVEALAGRESSTIRLVEYNDGDFQEVCLIRDYHDAYAALSARRPDFGLPRSGRPKAAQVDEEYALAFVGNGQAALAFLPTAMLEPETRCFPVATASIEVTPGRPPRSTLDVGRPTRLRLTPG